MPSWTAAGDPPYQIWMTHTPQGAFIDHLSGAGADMHEKYSLLRRRDPRCTRTSGRTSTRSTTSATSACSGTAGRRRASRQPPLAVGRRRQVPAADRARRPARHRRPARRRLPAGRLCRSAPDDLSNAAREQGVELRRGDIVCVRTGQMTQLARRASYLDVTMPGINLAAPVPLRGGGRDVHRRRHRRVEASRPTSEASRRSTATCSRRRARRSSRS